MSPTRLLTCVFRKMFSRCFLTVPVLMDSSSAVSYTHLTLPTT